MTRRETPLDATAIFDGVARHEVEYVIIGGLAAQAHGHVRTTQDVDIVPAPGEDNLRRLAEALGALGAQPAGDRRAPHGWSIRDALGAEGPLNLETVAGGLAVHIAPPGAAPYPALRSRAIELTVLGRTVVVAGRDDLIAMKRAAGRPIDRGDVLALTEPEALGS